MELLAQLQASFRPGLRDGALGSGQAGPSSSPVLATRRRHTLPEKSPHRLLRNKTLTLASGSSDYSSWGGRGTASTLEGGQQGLPNGPHPLLVVVEPERELRSALLSRNHGSSLSQQTKDRMGCWPATCLLLGGVGVGWISAT